MRGSRSWLPGVWMVGCLALATTVPAPARASAAPRVATRVEPSVVHVGDSIRVEIRVTPGTGVETPRWPESLGVFDLLAVSRVDSGGTTLLRAVLTTFELGQATVPPLPIPVRDGDGVDTLRSGAWRVSVVSLLPADSTAADTAAYRPAAAPLDLAGRFQWGALLFYLVLVGALVAAGWWILTHRPERKLLPMLEPVTPVRPPDLVALEALDAVAARAYVERGLFKPHYTEVLDVLRAYVEGRYGIEALDRTSAELSEALRAGGVPEEFRRRLDRLQEAADLVKFARVAPDADSATRLMADARGWVRETTAALAAAAAVPAPPPIPAVIAAPPAPPVSGRGE